MRPDTRVLVRSTLALAAGITVLLLAQTVAEFAGTPGGIPAALSMDTEAARTLATALAGTFDPLLAIVFTSVSIAVPLTATTYSVKLLELFIKDRVNLAVLLIFVFGVPNAVWLQYSLTSGRVTSFQLGLVMAMGVLYPALLVPYLWYVFRFLHPGTLLQRLVDEVRREVRRARDPAHASDAARVAEELVEYIGSVGIGSVDRSDRTTAVASVKALRQAVEEYRPYRKELPPAWFVTGREVAATLPDEAEVWIEARVMAELRALLSSASGKMHEVVGALAEDAAAMGLAPGARGDERVEQLVTEYFNTFVRLAINRLDIRAVYLLFHRYREFACGICAEHPRRTLEIAFYFQYYARTAKQAGLPFVVETVAHDLAALVRHAWEIGAPNREKLLERILVFDRELARPPLAGVKKALAILAGYFLLRGHPEPAARIAASFRGVDADLLHDISDDLQQVRREKYWEVVDRRANLDYVPEDHRAKVAEFFARLRTAGTSPVELRDPETDEPPPPPTRTT